MFCKANGANETKLQSGPAEIDCFKETHHIFTPHIYITYLHAHQGAYNSVYIAVTTNVISKFTLLIGQTTIAKISTYV